jgi:hypothetical protein
MLVSTVCRLLKPTQGFRKPRALRGVRRTEETPPDLPRSAFGRWLCPPDLLGATGVQRQHGVTEPGTGGLPSKTWTARPLRILSEGAGYRQCGTEGRS